MTVRSGRTRARAVLSGALAVVAGACMASAGHSQNAPGGDGHHAGEPCRSLHEYPVAFASDGRGGVVASFSFAGGAAHGSVPVPPADAGLIATHDAYVTDLQLGSYERPPGQPAGRLTCRVNPTYHFYCPATNTVEQLCLTWVVKQLSTEIGRGSMAPAPMMRTTATDRTFADDRRYNPTGGHDASHAPLTGHRATAIRMPRPLARTTVRGRPADSVPAHRSTAT